MLTILTPSKTMNFTSAAPRYVTATQPVFHVEAQYLRSVIQGYEPASLRKLMSVSSDLAQKVHAMYRGEATKSAFWAYDGDVFKGVQAAKLAESDALFAQDHVLVPSGLYGLVRPFDLISPYRLEMKAKLAAGEADNLYQFWGDKLGRYVEEHAGREVLMLSSYEYAKTITPYLASETRVVTPAFIDKRSDGTEAQVAIYNKMMRGVMGRWVIDRRINSLDAIHEFTAHGYAYSKERSAPDRPVFYREIMTPLKFS
jgi:cytoplasmic iron level regulating protein YaaA (DUF328/UPF0246 family)